MKKLISCLLVVMMLFTAAGFAEEMGRIGKTNLLRQFLKETDPQTQDIAVQIQSGDDVADLVIRMDGDNLHLVTRNNAVEDGHVQFNPTGIYLGSEGPVTLLRYATVTTVMQDLAKEVDAMLEQVVNSVPKEKIPTHAELKKAINELAILASAVEAQEQADAATLSSAALSFVNKFKPEYILDVKEEQGSVEISLRSDAYATALAEAMDEMMSNPALAELVNRRAALKGGKNFADLQREWAQCREETLKAVRSIESTESIDENGHWVTHFRIGEGLPDTKVLKCCSDAYINVENGEAEITVDFGFEDEDPLMVYELAVNPSSYREKLTAGDSLAELQIELDNYEFNSGNLLIVEEGKEELLAAFGLNYLYMRGPKGGISTSVRETWSGKIRYELVAETAEGEEASIILDFYQDENSLVCELNTSESDEPALFKISRIEKVTIDDLSASENINEITADQIKSELEFLLKLAIPAVR